MSEPETVAPQAQPVEIGDEPFALTATGDAAEEQEHKPRSRVRTIVLSSLLAVGLAGAAALGYAGWQIASQKDATITTPEQIGTLRLDQTEDGKTTADYLQTALSAEVDLDKAVGAVYLDA